MMEILVSLMGYAQFFQSSENQWGSLFVGQLPSWLTINDPMSLRHFYHGNSTLYDHVNYAPWIVPASLVVGVCAVLYVHCSA